MIAIVQNRYEAGDISYEIIHNGWKIGEIGQGLDPSDMNATIDTKDVRFNYDDKDKAAFEYEVEAYFSKHFGRDEVIWFECEDDLRHYLEDMDELDEWYKE